MQKIEVPERYQKSTPRPQTTTPTCDEWQGIGYRPREDCPACHGAGFLHPMDGPNVLYWKIIPCYAPGCLLDSIRGGQPTSAAQTFDNFVSVAGAEKAFKAAKALASGEASFIWLLIYGQPGNGKTHLCNAVLRAVHDRGLKAQMVLAGDLFSTLREAMRDHTTDTALRRYKDAAI